MSGLFSVPKVPRPQPIIMSDSPQVTEAANAEAARMKKKKGAASTILTGPEGVTETAATGKATLGA